MTAPRHIDRRTVLKTVTRSIVGGTVLSGTGGATAVADDGATSRRGNVTPDLEIFARHDHAADEHRFELDTNEVSSGWTTMRFHNRTDHTHFAYLAKLPEAAISGANEDGVDVLDYYVEHVTRPFQFVMDDILPETEPDPADLSDKYSNPEEDVIFPGWFGDVLPSGGAGMTSGHSISMTTVDLEPGEYIVECYVKTEEGQFHSYLGMIDQLSVTDERDGTEPEATLDVSLSTAGIEVDGTVDRVHQTVAVHVEDQQVYDNLLGHDLHLIRLDDASTTEDLAGWTNWMAPAGLVSDGSEPGQFIGGVQTILTPGLLEGEETRTAYVHTHMPPGEYAMVSEVPSPADHGLLETFEVPTDGTYAASPDANGSARSRGGADAAVADPGPSRHFGSAPEAAEDDLSERAANSAMHDSTKAVFDRLANVDIGDHG